MRNTCISCRYWDQKNTKGPDRDMAECRRYAPREERDGTDAISPFSWPVTKSNDWCGEYSGELQDNVVGVNSSETER
jgi:hypothetical protein